MEEKKSKTKTIKTGDIVEISLMAAIIYVATAVLNIPSNTGVVHLGDSMIFLTAVLFGNKKAAIAGALGMGLFDVLSPYIIWAPFTFVIKGLMGYIAGSIVYRNGKKGMSFWNNIFAFLVAGLFMIVGYYFAGSILFHSFIVPLGDVLGNVVQVVAGSAVALPLSEMLKKTNIIKK